MKRIVFVFIILMIAIPIAHYYMMESNKKKLPIINPSELVPDVVDPELRNKASGHKIQDFEFVNQNGDLIKS